MPERHRDPPPGQGAGAPRPAFDVVARGYDPDQVDSYVQALWRYSGNLTARVAEAEAALRHERERLLAEGLAPDTSTVGPRIGQMLDIAAQLAEEMVVGARLVAEQTLYEVVRESGAHHPIAHEAREQAAKLLADATSDARRLARARQEDIEAEITRSSAALDALRRQQGEALGAMLRLRALVGSEEFTRATADVAAAGREPPAAAVGRPRAAAAEEPAAPSPPPPPPRRAPADVVNGELAPVDTPVVSPPSSRLRPGAGDEIVDAEVLDGA